MSCWSPRGHTTGLCFISNSSRVLCYLLVGLSWYYCLCIYLISSAFLMSYTRARLGAAELPGEFPSLPCVSPRLLVRFSPRPHSAERPSAGLAGLWFKKTALRNQWKQAVCLICFAFLAMFWEDTLVERGSELRVLEIGVLLTNLGKVACNKTEVSYVMIVRSLTF